DHPLTQAQISKYLEKEYGISIERRAISSNLSLLKESGVSIRSTHNGNYLDERDFEDSELRLLIDGVLCSRHITASHSKALIEKICGLSNKYFKAHVKHVYSVNDWNKTDNQELFLNIELVDTAIEKGVRLAFDYNKTGADKRLHKTAAHDVSPYQLTLHNQRYYLMARNERWGDVAYYRLDRITNMELSDERATPIKTLPGYENGIDYKRISTALPYMYSDEPEHITMLVSEDIVDQVIDWFGKDIHISRDTADDKYLVTVLASPNAMEHWALQYLRYVEIQSPESMRQRIKDALDEGGEKYYN
ncbi:MAG: WYL domain-containing protein, partial [Oscillospiraceae bacterium]|nr:WYL domain-containing protein [Oscillospiraceae bacterium]